MPATAESNPFDLASTEAMVRELLKRCDDGIFIQNRVDPGDGDKAFRFFSTLDFPTLCRMLKFVHDHIWMTYWTQQGMPPPPTPHWTSEFYSEVDEDDDEDEDFLQDAGVPL